MSRALNVITNIDTLPILTLFVDATRDTITGAETEVDTTGFIITALCVSLTDRATGAVEAELS
jgi:hypothetical protein